MTGSPNLNVTELAPNQNAKVPDINNGFVKIDGATQGQISPAFTSNVRTLTADEFTSNYEIVIPSLSATGTLTVPLSQRVFAINNLGNASHDVVVKGASGATVDVPALSLVELRNDGAGIYGYTAVAAVGAPPSGAAGGDLGGTYPNPTVLDLSHVNAGTLGVAHGGLGLSAGTSGGVLAFTASGSIASSGALTAHGIVIGGGAGAVPTVTAAMTNGQLLIGATGANPAPQTVSGDISINSGGTVALTPSISAITCSGSDQASAQTLTANINILTAGGAAPFVRLKASPAGPQKIVNKLTSTATVYPASGAQIDALGTNAAALIVSGGAAIFDPTSTTQWYSS